jgi:cytochrome b pre-mRNA-processing protein 3
MAPASRACQGIRSLELNRWNPFRRDPNEASARRLYAAIVAQARRPAFYAAGGVPDSLDGRFELVALHVYLVLRRLKGDPTARALAQGLVDLFFADMDASLREMGAGDLGIGKRVQKMAAGFYGRVAAYDGAESPDGIALALKRNLYGTIEASAEQIAAMTAYVGRAQALVTVLPLAEIAAGRPRFPEPPRSDAVRETQT